MRQASSSPAYRGVRSGDWKAAVEALKTSAELNADEEFGFRGFFLAMAHWQLGEKEEARKWHDRAVSWMDKNQPKDEELIRFRVEAAELLMIADEAKPKSKSKSGRKSTTETFRN